MALTGEGLSAADVAAVTGNNNGFGWGGEGGWWVILFLFALMGGNGWGGFGGNDMVLPYLFNNTTQGDVNRGFDTAGLAAQLSGIQSSISNGFATAEVAGCNRAMDAMQTAYGNQIASMNQNFAAQTAIDSRLDSMQMAQQECCCENRAQTADLKYTVATEAAANRAAGQANTQAILDKLCQLELDGVKERNAELLSENNALKFAQSQTAQTAALVQDNNAQTAALINRIAPYPTPSYIVANPYAGYGTNYGCGCGVA